MASRVEEGHEEGQVVDPVEGDDAKAPSMEQTPESAKKRKRKRKKKGDKCSADAARHNTTEGESVSNLADDIGDLKLDAEERVNVNSQPSTPVQDNQTSADNKGQSSSHRKRNRHRRNKKATESKEDDLGNENQQHVDGSENRTPPQMQKTPNRHGSAAKNSPSHLSHKKRLYEKYWALEDVSAGLKRGELIQGPLRISKRNYEMAWVSAPNGGRDIYLEGMLGRNRALDGDVVALSILPRNKWKVMRNEYEAYKKGLDGEGTTTGTPSKEDKKSTDGTPGTPSHRHKNKHQETPIRTDDVPDAYLQKTAHVVYIIEKKHTRAASGHLKPLNIKTGDQPDGLFSPTDNRLPRIRIPRDLCPPGFFDRPQDSANTLFVARITEWSENSSFDNYFAIGKIARSLGEAGEIEPETEGIFFEYGIDQGPFPDDVLACLPKQSPWSIPEEEITSRRDFRDECVFTIDPLTARDLDDALHCKRLPDGLIEVGVHIADVSYFVRQGTPLDEIAQERATSIYMVQTVVPMLPRRLCEELCSLNPDEDRLTFSVVWVMTEKGEIRSDWKGRGIIRSRVKMAYEHAQEMINKPNKKWESSELPPIAEGTDVADISSHVNLLHRIARHLRRNRLDNGALRLDQAKLQFDLDKETGMPLGYHVYQQRDSNKLIEEFMLLANMTVAHHIYNAFPEMALLRRHPKPHQKQLDDLLELCKNLGIKFQATSSKQIQISLAQFPSGSAKHEILVQLTMRPMKNALYFSSGSLPDEEYGHYALSVPFYTHFTSPIRRYPDIIVHRLLAASLSLDEPIDKEAVDMDAITSHCNDRKLAAKQAGELSLELFFAIFVRECGPLEDDGVILGIMDQSFDVFVPALGVTKRIYCRYCPGLKRYEPYNKKEQQQPEIKLIWATGTEKKPGKDVVQVLNIFTAVRVLLTTEHQAEEKSKHLKVYARLKPPTADSATDADQGGDQEGGEAAMEHEYDQEGGEADMEHECDQEGGEAVKKKLFDDGESGDARPRNASHESSDSVIVESEEESETETKGAADAATTDATDQQQNRVIDGQLDPNDVIVEKLPTAKDTATDDVIVESESGDDDATQ